MAILDLELKHRTTGSEENDMTFTIHTQNIN
jgi:hypothetical protein